MPHLIAWRFASCDYRDHQTAFNIVFQLLQILQNLPEGPINCRYDWDREKPYEISLVMTWTSRAAYEAWYRVAVMNEVWRVSEMPVWITRNANGWIDLDQNVVSVDM